MHMTKRNAAAMPRHPIPLIALALTAATPTHAELAAAEDDISRYAEARALEQAAEDAANDRVTWEICGWGRLDTLTPYLKEVARHGVRPQDWPALTALYRDALRARREAETHLSAHTTPAHRFTGLHPTDGCLDREKQRIRQRWGR